MERPDPESKEKGELTIRYKSEAPPDPDSVGLEFAKQLVEEGHDVIVTVKPKNHNIEVFPDPPED